MTTLSLFEKGKEYLGENRYTEALSIFSKITKKQAKSFEADLFFDAFIEISRIHLQQQKHEKAEDILTIALQEKEKFDFHNEREKKNQIEYKLFASFAEIYEHQANLIGKENIAALCNFVDKSFKFCQFCIETSAKVLSKILKRTHAQEEMLKQWSGLYANSVWNSINPLFAEAENTSQKIVYEKILEITEKLFRFYQICEQKSAVKESYSKGRFHRAMCLNRLTGQSEKEAEILLKKDYEYCDKKKNEQSKNVTRLELVKYYYKTEQFEKLKPYLNGSKEKKQFQMIMENYNSILKTISSIKSRDFLTNLSQKAQIKKFELLFEQLEEQNMWNKKYCQVAEQIRGSLSPIHSKQLIKEIYYQASLVAFNNFQFQQALSFIDTALQSSQEGTIEHYNMFCHKTAIIDSIQSESPNKIKEMYKKCEQLTKNLPLQQKKQFNSWYKESMARNSRNQKYKMLEIYSETEKELFRELERNQVSSNQEDSECEEVNGIEIYGQQNGMEDEGSNGFQRNFMRDQNKKKNKEESFASILQKKYRQRCSENPQVFVVRKWVLQNIANNAEGLSKDLAIEEIFCLNEDQLQGLLDIFQLKKWNFQNCEIRKKGGFLGSLSKRPEIGEVVSFKLASSVDKMEDLLKVFEKLSSLEILDLRKIACPRKILQLQTENLNFPQPQKLKILKLRSCHLEDSFLTILNNFKNLETLNLGDNKIKGEGIEILKSMPQLSKLNLSQNPFENGDFIHVGSRLKKFKIKNLEKIPQHPFQKLIYQSEIVDLSKSAPDVVLGILQEFVSFITNKELLPWGTLKQIRLKYLTISKQIFQIIGEISRLAPNLRRVDIRFSDCYGQQAELWQKVLRKRGKEITIIWKKFE